MVPGVSLWRKAPMTKEMPSHASEDVDNDAGTARALVPSNAAMQNSLEKRTTRRVFSLNVKKMWR